MPPPPLRPLLFGIFLAAVAATAGCGEAGKRPVSGIVTFEGKPVEEGRITFRAADDKAATASAPIADGKFTAECAPGKYKVEITAGRAIPGKFNTTIEGTTPVVEMYIPKKYNSKTELTKDIGAGKNDFDFALTR